MNPMLILDQAAASESSPMMMIGTIGYMVVILGVLYFVMIRPQNKKRKKEQELRKSAQVGDEITTIGGITGRIIAVKDESESIVLETGSDRSRIHVKRWAIESINTVHEDDT